MGSKGGFLRLAGWLASAGCSGGRGNDLPAFPPHPFDDRPGPWMYHCHILEHHAAGMMGHFEVVR